MTKLSDTQALILSAAAQRPEHIALPLPESLRGGAAAKVVGAMLAKGFLEEVDADMRNGEPVWRETGDGHGVTLVATDAGLAAIGIETEDGKTAPAGATDAATEEPAPDTPTEPKAAPKTRTAREGTGLSRERGEPMNAASHWKCEDVLCRPMVVEGRSKRDAGHSETHSASSAQSPRADGPANAH
ncbi:hypothetical protein [Pararhodobacter marinus]|uniref:hypothetical protein n=1 Tax=Pararhodobacter marinus TaxID=2184063 RepID=UPI001FE8E3B7|nr:hypothetical protein [Pararhodobacter marinus]